MSDDLPPPSPVQYDDDGFPVPQPVNGSDLADLMQLLLWGRKQGFAIGPMVRIGKIALQVADTRQQRGGGKPSEPEPSIWEEHGFKEPE